MADWIANNIQNASRLIKAGELGKARPLAEAAASVARTNATAQRLYAYVLLLQGDYAGAETQYRRVVELQPADIDARITLAQCLTMIVRPEEAVAELRIALDRSPGHRAGAAALAAALLLSGRPIEAASICRPLLEAGPGDANLTACLAMARLQAGYADEALALFTQAAALEPGRLTHFGGAAAASNYAANATPGSIAGAHREYGRALSRILGPRPPAHLFGTSGSDDAGPLRVGFLSPDFRRHAVPMFLLPILDNLDRDRVQPLLYSCSPTVDDVTERLRRSAALVDVSALQPDALAARIAADRIHILVDLAGHTVNNRLPVFAFRPAPLQVTYLGYPATTGVDAIDYRIVDDQTDPPRAPWMDIERPARLNPCLLAFAPPGGAPPVAPPPSAEGKPFTFAAMSNLSKFNEPLIRTWTAVLDAAPGSRLLIRHTTLAEEASRLDLAARFHAAGADPARIIIEPPRADTAGVLASYADVDVCLDTFPYSGTTTVCESLFMGVPVVVMPGLTSASRQSLTLLKAVGLDELVAADEAAFVRIAAGLSADPVRLAALRASLRARFLASAVGDGRGLARRFADLLAALWAARSNAAGGPVATIMPP